MRLIHTNITPAASPHLSSQRDLLDKMGHLELWQAAQSLIPSTLGAPLVPNSPTCSTIQLQPLCHHRFRCKGKTASTLSSSNSNYNNKNSLSSSQIQATRLSSPISIRSSSYSSPNRSLISTLLARLTHSNLEGKDFVARTQISSSNLSNAWQEPAKSWKQRQISKVSASLSSRKLGKEVARPSNPRHNNKAGLMLLPLAREVKILEPSACQFKETSKYSYRKTVILWVPSLLQARAQLYSYNQSPIFNKLSLYSSPSKRTTSHIPGMISIV